MQCATSFGADCVHTTPHRRSRYDIPSGEQKVFADTGDIAGLLLARAYAVTDHKKAVLAMLLFCLWLQLGTGAGMFPVRVLRPRVMDIHCRLEKF